MTLRMVSKYISDPLWDICDISYLDSNPKLYANKIILNLFLDYQSDDSSFSDRSTGIDVTENIIGSFHCNFRHQIFHSDLIDEV